MPLVRLLLVFVIGSAVLTGPAHARAQQVPDPRAVALDAEIAALKRERPGLVAPEVVTFVGLGVAAAAAVPILFTVFLPNVSDGAGDKKDLYGEPYFRISGYCLLGGLGVAAAGVIWWRVRSRQLESYERNLWRLEGKRLLYPRQPELSVGMGGASLRVAF